MSVICTKAISISIPAWMEYTGIRRHGIGPYGNLPSGDPNILCAPHSIVMSGDDVEVDATCSLPMLYLSEHTAPCSGCTFTDTSHFEFCATRSFLASVPGTCLIVFSVDFTTSLAMGIVRGPPACTSSPGMFGSADGFLDTYLNGALVDSVVEGGVLGHHVASVNVSRHVNAGELIEHLFQVWCAAGNANYQWAKAAFSFTPD